MRPSALLVQCGRYYVHYPSPQGERVVEVAVDEWQRLEWANRERLIYSDRVYRAYEPDVTVAARPETVAEALAEMVARGKGNQPRLAGRLDSAAELVQDGRVILDGDAAQIGPYRITAKGCTCGDFQHRGGWCKHRLAVRMARHLAANGFALPEPVDEAPAPLVSAANRRLIESGAVIDAEQRSRAAYHAGAEAAQRAALTRLSQGAGSIPADLARRAGNVGGARS